MTEENFKKTFLKNFIKFLRDDSCEACQSEKKYHGKLKFSQEIAFRPLMKTTAAKSGGKKVASDHLG